MAKQIRPGRSYRGARRDQFFGRRPRGHGKATIAERRLIRQGMDWREAIITAAINRGASDQ